MLRSSGFSLIIWGKNRKMKQVMHGKTDNILVIKKNKIFQNFPKNFIATRYHSLSNTKKPA